MATMILSMVCVCALKYDAAVMAVWKKVPTSGSINTSDGISHRPPSLPHYHWINMHARCADSLYVHPKLSVVICFPLPVLPWQQPGLHPGVLASTSALMCVTEFTSVGVCVEVCNSCCARNIGVFCETARGALKRIPSISTLFFFFLRR